MNRYIPRIAAICGLTAGVMFCLLGCGGGGGGAGGTVDLSGTVTAPEGTTIARVATPHPGLLAFLRGSEAEAATVTGGTPVPGAQVTVYRYDTGDVVGTTRTDENGNYTVRVPEGIDVAVIATKGDIRLSALVTDVGPQRRRADVTAETTVVAEAFAHVHPLSSGAEHAVDLSEADLTPVLAAAQQHLAELNRIDMSVHTGGILPEHFGGGLRWPMEGENEIVQALEAVQNAVPTVVSTDVALAKTMVQQLRDAGTSLGNAFNSELLAQQQVIEKEVIPSFEHIGSPLALLDRMFLEQVRLVADKQTTTYDNILDLPDGEYQEQVADPSAGYPYELVRIGDAAEGTVIIHGATDDPSTAGKTLTLTRTDQTAASSVSFTVTSSTDPTLDYHGSVSVSASLVMTLSAYFKDAEITTPVTLNGTVTPTVPTQKFIVTPASVTQLVFTGSLTSAKLDAEAGTWTLKFASNVPSGQSFYNYPTSWTIENLSIQTKGTSKPLKLTGALSVKFTTLTTTTKSSRATTETVQPVPTEFTFTGTYNGDKVTSFTGTVSAQWTNPNLDDDFPTGTVTVTGETTVSGQPKTHVNVQLTTTAAPNQGTLTLTISHDPVNLSGTATGSFDSHGDLTEATLTVTNQSGIQVQITTSDGGDTVTGSITTRGGVKVADIAVDPDLGQVSIHYADGTVESLG